MTGVDVNVFDPRCSFIVNGVSYIGRPREHTVMYVTKKVGNLLQSLENVSNCLVFVETGTDIPKEAARNNCIVMTDHPQFEYAKIASSIADQQFAENQKRKYTFVDQSYYLGENTQIGADTVIMPGCWIDHDVVIGARTIIHSGCRLSHCVIGSDCMINENAVIGTQGFTMADDDHGNKMRIPSLGRVIIGNHVEIGALDSIARGSGDDTVIDDHVKLDALVYIAHDVHLSSNAELAGGSTIGGYASIGENSFLGLNSAVRNRRSVAAHSFLGMGAIVVRSVSEEDQVVVGNPAKILREEKE